MPYDTGNPLGSNDFKDLSDNAVNFDKLSNGDEPAYVDRLGHLRISVSGMNEQFNDAQEGRDEQFQTALLATGFVDIGNYAAGLTITARNQVFARNGVYYSANAALVLPYTLTGDWAAEGSNFILRADAPLRSDLASANGATMVGRGSSTVGADLSSAETRITALEQNPSTPIGYAASPAEETAKFAAGFSFVLRTDLILPAPPPVPTYTLDANIYTGNTSTGPFQGSGVVGGYQELAFSFTAVATGVLGRIELPLIYNSGTASDWIIEIRADSAGLPSGAVLASASLGAFVTPTTAAAALTAPRVATLAFNQVAGTKYWACCRVLTTAGNSVYSALFTGSGAGNTASRKTTSGAWTAESAVGNTLFRNYRVTYS